MHDDPKTIEHDPHEQHRGQPQVGVHFDPKEPIFNVDPVDFVIQIVVTIIVVWGLTFPLKWAADKIVDPMFTAKPASVSSQGSRQ